MVACYYRPNVGVRGNEAVQMENKMQNEMEPRVSLQILRIMWPCRCVGSHADI